MFTEHTDGSDHKSWLTVNHIDKITQRRRQLVRAMLAFALMCRMRLIFALYHFDHHATGLLLGHN